MQQNLPITRLILPLPICRLSGVLALLVGALGQNACDRTPVGVQNPTPARASVLGQQISFNTAGNSQEYRTFGWSKTEEQFTWSEGRSAKLELPVGPNPGTLMLHAKLAAYINPPDLPSQPVEVYANGAKIADWEVGNTAEFTATIPAAVSAKKSNLELEFRTPKALSPKSAGVADDARVLGIAMHNLRVFRADAR